MTEAFENHRSPRLKPFQPVYAPKEPSPPPFAKRDRSPRDDLKHDKSKVPGKGAKEAMLGLPEANASLLQYLDPGRPDIASRELQLHDHNDRHDDYETYYPPRRKVGIRGPDPLPIEPAPGPGPAELSDSQQSKLQLGDLARNALELEKTKKPNPPGPPVLSDLSALLINPAPPIKTESAPPSPPTNETSSCLSKFLISAPEGSSQDSLPALRPPEAANSPDNGNHRLPPIQTQLGRLPPVLTSNGSSMRMSGASPYPLPSVTAASSPLSRIESGSWEHPQHHHVPSLAPPPPKPSPGAFSHSSSASLRDLLTTSPPASQSYASWRSPPKTSPHYLYDQTSTSKSPAAGYLNPADQTATGPGEPSPFSPGSHGNGAVQTGTFKCSHPGCTAAPFQTQYLLNSHANVHSQDRPHFCPIEGCSRGPGGKGFKRKNEMIRHGLVHNSPGYVCPFCPDQQHKYPRPDNLQRHVRVHHVDKNKDDPALRNVLSQRPEGSARGRRRRMNA